MNNEYKSTRMSKLVHYDKKYSKYWTSLYGSMFLHYFNIDASIEFKYKKSSRNFFSIEATNNILEEMITFNNYSYLEYELSEIISRIIYSMMLRGKAFVEIVYYFDNSNCIKGFDFLFFNYHKYIKFPEYTKFYYKKILNGKTEKGKFKIKNNNLICFKLSDLKFKKRDFYSIEKKIKNIDITKVPLDKINELNINLSEYEKEEAFELLLATKKIPWNYGSCERHITAPYYLYRLARFKEIKLNFLDYIIKQMNNKIGEIGGKYDFNGRIVYDTLNVNNIREIIKKMENGEIQISEVSEYLYCNKKYS